MLRNVEFRRFRDEESPETSNDTEATGHYLQPEPVLREEPEVQAAYQTY